MKKNMSVGMWKKVVSKIVLFLYVNKENLITHIKVLDTIMKFQVWASLLNVHKLLVGWGKLNEIDINKPSPISISLNY